VLIIEKQIDVGIIPRLAPSGRAEQIQMLNPKPPKLGLMLLESRDGGVSFHNAPIAPAGRGFEQDNPGVTRQPPRRTPAPNPLTRPYVRNTNF
jgi:hypothetical protein